MATNYPWLFKPSLTVKLPDVLTRNVVCKSYFVFGFFRENFGFLFWWKYRKKIKIFIWFAISEPGTAVEVEGSSPFFATILKNQQTASQQNQPFVPDFESTKETREGQPIINKLQDLIQSVKKKPEPITPTIIPDDSFDKFQKISSMMGAILSGAGIAEAKQQMQENEETEESAPEDEEEGSVRAAIIRGPAQWPLVSFNFENAFLRA